MEHQKLWIRWRRISDTTDQEGPEDNPWNSNIFDDMDLDEVSTSHNVK
jgi:hypothetical protein